MVKKTRTVRKKKMAKRITKNKKNSKTGVATKKKRKAIDIEAVKFENERITGVANEESHRLINQELNWHKSKESINQKENTDQRINRSTEQNKPEQENREKLTKKEKENLKKYGVARCPDCGSKDIIREHGEVYCRKCGFVIDEGYE